MNAKLSLPRPTRRRVLKLDRRSKDPDQRIRCRAILKVAAGLSCNAAAKELGCTPSTAVRIVARFASEGEAALLDARIETRAPALTRQNRIATPTWVMSGSTATSGPLSGFASTLSQRIPLVIANERPSGRSAPTEKPYPSFASSFCFVPFRRSRSPQLT